LLILRDQSKSLYDQYISTPIIADKVIDYLFAEKPDETKSNGNVALNKMIACLISPIREHKPDEFDRLIQPYKKNYKNSIEEDQSVESLAKSHSRSQDLKPTVERIELAHQINIEL
jgi:hypothetical protein